MFTGIVEEKGSVRYMQLTGESGVLAIKAKKVTRLREQALAVLTYATCKLFFAGWLAEVRRRTTHIVDISLEIGVLCDNLRFLNQAFFTAALNNATLMERQGTERALANTTPITG